MTDADVPGTTRAVSTPGNSISVAEVALVDQVAPASRATDSPSSNDLDVRFRDELDTGRHQLDLPRGEIDRVGRVFDGPHQHVSQRDTRKSALNTLELAVSHVDLGEPG